MFSFAVRSPFSLLFPFLLSSSSVANTCYICLYRASNDYHVPVVKRVRKKEKARKKKRRYDPFVCVWFFLFFVSLSLSISCLLLEYLETALKRWRQTTATTRLMSLAPSCRESGNQKTDRSQKENDFSMDESTSPWRILYNYPIYTDDCRKPCSCILPHLWKESNTCRRTVFKASKFSFLRAVHFVCRLDRTFLHLAAMVQAWYMDDSSNDQRLPHKTTPEQPVKQNERKRERDCPR